MSSVAIAAAVIGLSDLAFLAGYFGNMEIADIRSMSAHWTSYEEPDYVATGVCASGSSWPCAPRRSCDVHSGLKPDHLKYQRYITKGLAIVKDEVLTEAVGR